MRMRRLLLILIAVPLSACSSTTRITTYPRSYAVSIDGVEHGPSPATVLLPNTTFGGYTLTVKDGEKTVFEDRLELEFVPWGPFWPPMGIFYNLFAAAPEYEIDVAARSEPPSEERPKPHRSSRHPAGKVLTDLGFQFLDRGFLLEARYYLEVALRIDPNYPDAILGMAIYHHQKGEDEAGAWLARYAEATAEPKPPERPGPNSAPGP